MLGRLLRECDEKENNIHDSIVELDSFSRKPKKQLGRSEIVDTYVRHGNSIANKALALFEFLIVVAQPHEEIVNRRAAAKVFDRARKVAAQVEDNICRTEQLCNH